MSQDINVGVLAEQINSKADIDLRNIDTTKCDMVIEYQEPTEENDYTWYRLYATGWIEQGGINNTNAIDVAITLPIKMQNNNYSSFITPISVSYGEYMGNCIKAQTNTTIELHKYMATWVMSWQVSGKVDPSVMLNHEILPSKAKNEEFEHRVIAFQKPTADNNYTWYRKYADGWVEQGGKFTGYDVAITLPVVMSDTNYNIQSTGSDTVGGGGYQYTFYRSQTISGFKIVSAYAGSWYNNSGYWQVSGMVAE